MPVHRLETTDGGVILWYEQLGCVSFEGKLYFEPQRGICNSRQRLALAHAAEQHALAKVFRPEYNLDHPMVKMKYTLIFDVFLDYDPTDVFDRDACNVFCYVEKPKEGALARRVDEINPSFCRLQRWFRSYVQRERWKRMSSAFLMGSVVSRLGEESVVSTLLPELSALIVLRLRESLKIQ
jgi:hypothetical protein